MLTCERQTSNTTFNQVIYTRVAPIGPATRYCTNQARQPVVSRRATPPCQPEYYAATETGQKKRGRGRDKWKVVAASTRAEGTLLGNVQLGRRLYRRVAHFHRLGWRFPFGLGRCLCLHLG